MSDNYIAFGGVRFRAIDRHHAQALIGGLRNFEGEPLYDALEDIQRFPNHDDGAMFLLAEDDIRMDSLDLAYATDDMPDTFILGLIFQRNLWVEKSIVAWDTDNSPALVVLGDLQATNVKLFGNVHTVAGDLRCDTVWGQYNHGELHVLGAVTAWVIHADDIRMNFGRFSGVGAAVNSGGPDVVLNAVLVHEDGTEERDALHFPSTHRLADIVSDTLLVARDGGAESFSAACDGPVLAPGLSLLDHSKKERYEYRGFPAQIADILARLDAQWQSRGGQPLAIEADGAHHAYQRFESDGKSYRQISKIVPHGYDFALRATQDIATSEILLHLDYFDDEGDVRYQWSGGLDDGMLELKCVKCAVLEANALLR